MGSNDQGSALGEGLYWMAEKLAWGYEEVDRNPTEALVLFRQSAALGFSHALIRIGQFQEYGKGTGRDLGGALRSYRAAAKAGNALALAFLAKLLSRSSHLDRANNLWRRFFADLHTIPENGFLVASRGELLHDYIISQLRLGLEPEHKETLRRYKFEIAGHHQRLIENSPPDELDNLAGVMRWINLNLGPWPALT